jgi:hypothetical protein
MLILKPAGRGNWHAATMTIDGRHVQPLLVRVGSVFTFGGIAWRVCEVRP